MNINNMKIFHKVFKFFDKTEDKTRSKLSKYPVLYAIIGAGGASAFMAGSLDGGGLAFRF